MNVFNEIAKFDPALAERYKAAGILPPPAVNPCHRAGRMEQYEGFDCIYEHGHEGRCQMVRIEAGRISGMPGPSSKMELSQ